MLREEVDIAGSVAGVAVGQRLKWQSKSFEVALRVNQVVKFAVIGSKRYLSKGPGPTEVLIDSAPPVHLESLT